MLIRGGGEGGSGGGARSQTSLVNGAGLGRGKRTEGETGGEKESKPTNPPTHPPHEKSRATAQGGRGPDASRGAPQDHPLQPAPALSPRARRILRLLPAPPGPKRRRLRSRPEAAQGRLPVGSPQTPECVRGNPRAEKTYRLRRTSRELALRRVP